MGHVCKAALQAIQRQLRVLMIAIVLQAIHRPLLRLQIAQQVQRLSLTERVWKADLLPLTQEVL
jgi:hypothetical protein